MHKVEESFFVHIHYSHEHWLADKWQNAKRHHVHNELRGIDGADVAGFCFCFYLLDQLARFGRIIAEHLFYKPRGTLVHFVEDEQGDIWIFYHLGDIHRAESADLFK